MELINALVERRIGMVESLSLSSKQLVINEMLYRLDLETHRSTLKWGYGRLLELAPEELRSRWNSQCEKLKEAIIAEDVSLVEELIAGSARGLAALERSAVAAGHVPFEVQFYEIPVDGVVYRVVRDSRDAAGVETVVGGGVVSLEELVRCYHSQRQILLKTLPIDKLGGRGEYVPSGKPMNEEIGF